MIKLGLQYFADDEDIDIDNDQIEEEIRAALSDDDAEKADELVEKYMDYYDGDIEDEVFRWAIQEGCSDYVEAHAEDIELNDVDAGASSSYLNETDDEDMIDLLIDLGAFRSLEDYSDCAFATDTVNSMIIAFKPEFQKMVFEKLLDTIGMTKEEAIEALENDEASDTELPDDFADADYGTLAEVCKLLNVSAEEGELVYEEFDELDDSVPGWVVCELIEKLGFETEYEGTRSKFEELGVSFIKDIPKRAISGDKTWDFRYYGSFGPGESSEDIDFTVDVSDEEYEFLMKIKRYEDYPDDEVEYTEEEEEELEEFDLDAFIEENKELVNKLQDRVQIEAEEIDEECADYSYLYDEDDEEEFEGPSIYVRWPWEL